MSEKNQNEAADKTAAALGREHFIYETGEDDVVVGLEKKMRIYSKQPHPLATENARLRKLAYIGDLYTYDNTYKARLEELAESCACRPGRMISRNARIAELQAKLDQYDLRIVDCLSPAPQPDAVKVLREAMTEIRNHDDGNRLNYKEIGEIVDAALAATEGVK